MEAIEASLQGIEARMRIEAIRWLAQSPKPVSDGDRLKENILLLTGLFVRTRDDIIRAGTAITKLLTSQRRMAKSGHPHYDANRHILLKSTLDGIDREIRKTAPANGTIPIVPISGDRAWIRSQNEERHQSTSD